MAHLFFTLELLFYVFDINGLLYWDDSLFVRIPGPQDLP